MYTNIFYTQIDYTNFQDNYDNFSFIVGDPHASRKTLTLVAIDLYLLSLHVCLRSGTKL